MVEMSENTKNSFIGYLINRSNRDRIDFKYTARLHVSVFV